MTVKCGNRECPNDNVHENRHQVRECYHNSTLDKTNDDMAVPSDGPMWPPTADQMTYLRRLLSQRSWPHEYTEEQLVAFDRAEVSALISGLAQAPWKEGKGPDVWKVPAGKYATERITDDGEVLIDFWKVSTPTEGVWKGYTFVRRLKGAPGTFEEFKLNYHEATVVLSKLEKDLEGASRLFGKTFRVCGHCSSPLTLKRSRDAGYGEKCAANHGYAY